MRVELPVLDAERAARFYRDVFGWRFECPSPCGAMDAWALGASEKRGASGSTVLFAGRGAPGTVGWLDVTPEVALVEVVEIAPRGIAAAIGVDEIEEAFARIERAGGRRVSGREVVDDIRTAVFADCEGNEIGLWSPAQEAEFSWQPHAGASSVDGVTLQYVELQALSLERASRFYGDVFGWEFTPPHVTHAPGGPFPSARRPLYGHDVVLYCNERKPEVGLRAVDEVQLDGGIGVAVGVDSIPAALQRVATAGGGVHRDVEERADISVAIVSDPEGNRVSLLAPVAGRRVPWTPHVMADAPGRARSLPSSPQPTV